MNESNECTAHRAYFVLSDNWTNYWLPLANSHLSPAPPLQNLISGFVRALFIALLYLGQVVLISAKSAWTPEIRTWREAGPNVELITWLNWAQHVLGSLLIRSLFSKSFILDRVTKPVMRKEERNDGVTPMCGLRVDTKATVWEPATRYAGPENPRGVVE